jgi:hypothetical protein
MSSMPLARAARLLALSALWRDPSLPAPGRAVPLLEAAARRRERGHR